MKKIIIQIQDINEYTTRPISKCIELINKCKEEKTNLIEFDFQNIVDFPILFKAFLDYFNIIVKEQNLNIQTKVSNVLPEHKIFI